MENLPALEEREDVAWKKTEDLSQPSCSSVGRNGDSFSWEKFPWEDKPGGRLPKERGEGVPKKEEKVFERKGGRVWRFTPEVANVTMHRATWG